MAGKPAGQATLNSETLQIPMTAREKVDPKSRAARAGVDVSNGVLRHVLPSAASLLQNICRRLHTAGTHEEEKSLVLAELNDLPTKLRSQQLCAAVVEPQDTRLESFDSAIGGRV
jgi:hypothetical protein